MGRRRAPVLQPSVAQVPESHLTERDFLFAESLIDLVVDFDEPLCQCGPVAEVFQSHVVR